MRIAGESQLVDWVREHGVDTILGALGIVGVGGVVKFSNEVIDMWRDRPWPLAFCCLLAFALGTWFYHSQGWRETLVERRREERRRVQEERDAKDRHEREEEEAARERAERARMLVLRLEPWHKTYLRALQEHGGTMETQSVEDRMVTEQLYPIRTLLEKTRVSGMGAEHVWRVSLNGYGAYVVEECADLLDEAVAHEGKGKE